MKTYNKTQQVDRKNDLLSKVVAVKIEEKIQRACRQQANKPSAEYQLEIKFFSVSKCKVTNFVRTVRVNPKLGAGKDFPQRRRKNTVNNARNIGTNGAIENAMHGVVASNMVVLFVIGG